MAELQQTTGLATLSEEAGGGAPRVQVGAMSARIAKSGRTPNARPSVNISSLGSERTMMKLYDTNNDGQIDEDELKVMARDSMRINKTNRWLYRVEFVLATALLLLAMSNFGTTYVAEVWADEATRQMNVVMDENGQWVLSPTKTAELASASASRGRRLYGQDSPEDTCPQPSCTGNPAETCFYDAAGCMSGVDTLGCNAGGHANCRFCGFGPFRKCPVLTAQTGQAWSRHLLDELPYLKMSMIERLHSVTHPCTQGSGMCSAKITSWVRLDETWMALYLDDGATALISNNLTEIRGPATGVVSFDGDGQAHAAGGAVAAIHVPLAESLCANFSCSLQRCVVATVDEIVRQVKCDTVSLWEWPTGVTLPGDVDAPFARRQLSWFCSNDFKPSDYAGSLSECNSQCDQEHKSSHCQGLCKRGCQKMMAKRVTAECYNSAACSDRYSSSCANCRQTVSSTAIIQQ